MVINNKVIIVTQMEPSNDLIEQFWQVEAIEKNSCSLSEESVSCEEHIKGNEQTKQ